MYDQTAVLLYGIEGPINLGSICRAMANTGFRTLRFHGELKGTEKEVRNFAVHAKDILRASERCEDLDDLLTGREVIFGFTPRNPWEDGKGLDMDGFHEIFARALAEERQIGLLFGNEKRGLENAQLARCTYRVALPTSESYASMNLAQAVLVALWELRRRHDATHSQVGQAPPEWVDPEAKTVLMANIREFLDEIAFFNPQNPDLIWNEIQAMLGGRDWRPRELELLHAIFGKAHSRYRWARREADKAH